MISDSIGFAAGDSLSIYSTHDAWKTFKRDSLDIEIPPSETRAESLWRLTSIGHDIYAVGDENIFKLDRSASPLSSVQLPEHAVNPYPYVQVKPNPAANHTTIVVYGLYSIADGPQTLVIRDVLGRQVMDLTQQFLHNSNGSWSAIDVNLAGIASGAYMVVYESAHASKSGTIVVLR